MNKIAFCLIVFLRCFAVAQDDPFIDTIAHVRLAVIPVACGTEPDEKAVVRITEIAGTGFFVDFEGTFVTAAHVITSHFKWNRAGIPFPGCFPAIYVANPTWPSIKWFQFSPCFLDESIDIAICRTKDMPLGIAGLHVSRIHLKADESPDGTAVAFTGFPLQFTVPVTSKGIIAGHGSFTSTQPEILIDKACLGRGKR